MEKRLDFSSVCDEVRVLLEQKNSAYGSSVNQTYEHYGLMAYLIRMEDKVNRLRTLVKDSSISEDDEKIEDTLKDLAGYSILAIAQLRAGDKKSAFVEYAKSELGVLLDIAKNEGEESFKMQKAFNENILEVIKAFDQGEHSGFTASVATKTLNRLFRYQPLTHLTLEDDEWFKVTDGIYQNKRASNVFKDDDKFDGKPYCLDGPDGKPVLLEDYPYAYWGVFKDVQKEKNVSNGIETRND